MINFPKIIKLYKENKVDEINIIYEKLSSEDMSEFLINFASTDNLEYFNYLLLKYEEKFNLKDEKRLLITLSYNYKYDFIDLIIDKCDLSINNFECLKWLIYDGKNELLNKIAYKIDFNNEDILYYFAHNNKNNTLINFIDKIDKNKLLKIIEENLNTLLSFDNHEILKNNYNIVINHIQKEKILNELDTHLNSGNKKNKKRM